MTGSISRPNRTAGPSKPGDPADPDVRNQDVDVAAIDFSGQGAPGEIAIADQLSGDLVVLRRNDNAPGHFDRRDFSLAGITQAVAITAVRLPSSTADSIVVLGKDAADAAKVFIIESRGAAQPAISISISVHAGARALAVTASYRTTKIAVAFSGQDSGVEVLTISRSQQAALTVTSDQLLPIATNKPVSVAFVSNGPSLVAGLDNNQVAIYVQQDSGFKEAVSTLKTAGG